LDKSFAHGTFLRDFPVAPDQPTFSHIQHTRNNLVLDIFGDTEISEGDINKPIVSQESYLFWVSVRVGLLSCEYASNA
jgi:hypothetical protein